VITTAQWSYITTGDAPILPTAQHLDPTILKMLTKTFLASSAFAALAAAVPQYSAVPSGVPSVPDVPGYTDADASFSVTFVPAETPASVFGPDSQIAVSISHHPAMNSH
jgi:hypothetical protein